MNNLDIIKTTGMIMTGFTTSTSMVKQYIFSDLVKTDMMYTHHLDEFVSVVMPALNEELYVEETLKSLWNQNIFRRFPEKFEFILVDCESDDKTVKMALPYIDKLISSPRGKITARKLGIKAAQGGIIIAVDSDCIYPTAWLDRMISYFADPDVVAVSGPVMAQTDNMFLSGALAISACLNKVSGILYGGNSAFCKDAYQEIGGFRQVDELDRIQVHIEEEVEFWRRLSNVGKCIYDLKLPIITSARNYAQSQVKDEGAQRWWEERKSGLRF